MYSGFTSSTRSKLSTILYVRRNALFRGSGRPWERVNEGGRECGRELGSEREREGVREGVRE